MKSISTTAEQGLLVPGDGVGEGIQGLVGGAEERPSGKSRQVAGDVIRGSQLGRDFKTVNILAQNLGKKVFLLYY
jgi:hypothetical protein